MTEADVVRRLGNPLRTRVDEERITWNSAPAGSYPVVIRKMLDYKVFVYSESLQDGSFYSRQVWLESSGRVVNVVAEFYQD